MTKLELIEEEIRYLSKSDLFQLHNEYAQANGYNLIYSNDEDTITDYFENDLNWFLREVGYSDYYSMDDEYFTFDGNAKIKSFDDLDDEIDFDGITSWIARNDLFEEYAHLFGFYEDCEEEEEE